MEKGNIVEKLVYNKIVKVNARKEIRIINSTHKNKDKSGILRRSVDRENIYLDEIHA